MKTEIENVIKDLLAKIADAKAEDAMMYAQAVLNLSHTMASQRSTELMK